METLPTSLHIGVIRGGTSPEYDVSLQTGANILENLRETHKPIDILISKDGTWHMNGVERPAVRIFKHVDVVVNALHGEFGEDGGIQEILDHHGVAYTGSDKYASAISMNKWLTKEHLKKAGIKTPISALVRREDSLVQKAKEIWSSMPNPLVVKPTCGGSSIGLYIARTYEDLLAALEAVLLVHGSAIVEEYIAGREATCGVTDNFRGKSVYMFPPIEIIPPEGKTFDYDAKYSGKSKEIAPGQFSAKDKEELERLSALVHKTLGLSHYSRSDFIISPKRGIYFLEVNTLPGMTKESLFPKALASVGVSVKEFLNHILHLAVNEK